MTLVGKALFRRNEKRFEADVGKMQKLKLW